MEQRLMIVDDSEVCGHTLELALFGCRGLPVERFVSGPDAWTALNERGSEFAAMVTDIQLGPTSGFELIGFARSRDARVVIIAVSGSPDNLAAQNALAAGANAFFPKPFSPSEVRHRLEVLLDRA